MISNSASNKTLKEIQQDAYFILQADFLDIIFE